MVTNQLVKISRSKLDLFLRCKRCFWLEKVKGVRIPDGARFSLNLAVDQLMKKEFDSYRASKKPHPIMEKYGITAVPFNHPYVSRWQDSIGMGLSYTDETSRILLYGGLDDVWEDKEGKLHVVDYKATSTQNEISLDDKWKIGYKRQVEVYQWLLQKNGFNVSDVSYFVFVNGLADKSSFQNKLEFESQIIAYTGNPDWLPKTLVEIRSTLEQERPPKEDSDCPWCSYTHKRNQAEEVSKEEKKLNNSLWDFA